MNQSANLHNNVLEVLLTSAGKSRFHINTDVLAEAITNLQTLLDESEADVHLAWLAESI